MYILTYIIYVVRILGLVQSFTNFLSKVYEFLSKPFSVISLQIEFPFYQSDEVLSCLPYHGRKFRSIVVISLSIVKIQLF